MGLADKLLVRPKFVENVSEPVLDQLLDRLVRKKYMNPEEVDRARVKPRDDKARDVFDTVKRKGSRASEYFIKKHQKLDPKSDLSSRMRKCLQTVVY
uniref:CARD domain-containing protein n=1 Tax=Neogobius melanostomus TaxID=47308 RepID=A0A8C6SRY4_9GOBI